MSGFEELLEKYFNGEAKTKTENGAAAYVSSGSYLLDLFATVGALRHLSDDKIINRFLKAFYEDADLAMKLLFYARDVRGGLGERRVFRTILAWLAQNKPAAVIRNLEAIAEFGRFDDLLSLLGSPCEKEMTAFLKKQLTEDMAALETGRTVSLLAKWLPSVNASSKETVRNAKRIAKALDMNDAAYRKLVSKLRARIDLIENHLREKDYSFDYEKQPSRAMFKYRAAFSRNDGERYSDFLSRVSRGEAALHAGNVMPYELVEPYLIGSKHYKMNRMPQEEMAALNATWQSLPDFGGDENALVVVDTSGSMYFDIQPSPAAVAISLGLYFAERNRGCFKNQFITFSEHPQLIKLKGETFAERLRYIMSFNENADTNLEAVFDLILKIAVENQVSQEELPEKLIIISDMEFNSCVQDASLTNFENAKKKFEKAGYRLPNVVFWNAASRNRHQPVRMNEQGVMLVSGVTPRLFSMVAGNTHDPYSAMMEVLNCERYAGIAA